jgi:hypothetical protein
MGLTTGTNPKKEDLLPGHTKEAATTKEAKQTEQQAQLSAPKPTAHMSQYACVSSASTCFAASTYSIALPSSITSLAVLKL